MKFENVAAPAFDLRDLPAWRAEHFPASDMKPWLDVDEWAQRIDDHARSKRITAEEAALCLKWATDGYVIIEKMFSDEQLDRAWEAYERAIREGVVTPQVDYGKGQTGKPGRMLNPHLKVAAFEQLLKSERAVSLVSLFLGARALPFQTIAGHVGSQQKTHSDSIHMTTFPQGYLVANWIAFEDVTADSGPLEYYPGSHRLPYVYSKDCGIDLDEGRAGYASYHEKYEPTVESSIRAHQLKPKYFLARKGDVLFWHANLLHGGSPISNADSSRRALVCHYFAEGCVCYHDYTGSPSYMTKLPAPKTPMLTRAQFDPAAYLALNPDVEAAGVDPYRHYKEFGYFEGRRTK